MVAFHSSAPLFPLIFGGVFVLVGGYFIAGRFFVDIYSRSRTYYGVTNQRILIVSGIFVREVKTLSLPNLSEISLTERSDGSGDILFGPVNPMFAMWCTMASFGMTKKLTPAFEFVDDVRQVHSLIQQARRKT